MLTGKMSLSDPDHSLSTRFHKGKGSNSAEKSVDQRKRVGRQSVPILMSIVAVRLPKLVTA